MRISQGLWNVIKREVRLLTSRPIYLVGMTLVPLLMAVFFVSLLGEGLPKKVPAAVVGPHQLDMSRERLQGVDPNGVC